MLETRPRFAVDRERHSILTREFMEAVREQNMEQLASSLAEDVVLHGDGGGKAPATRKPIVGRVEVARFILGGHEGAAAWNVS